MDSSAGHYTQHSSPHSTRRKNRSSTNLNHLTLAPLTTKLPLNDVDDIPDDLFTARLPHTSSYLQGKSAPTTPALFPRSPVTARSRSRSQDRRATAPAVAITKSKSAVHLPGGHRGSAHRKKDDANLSRDTRRDSDWLLRAGALISTETRESKGQAWLTTRESSTSLTGLRDTAEEAMERELAWEKELASRHASRHASRQASRVNSRHASRRGSLVHIDDIILSPAGSRLGSRSHSRIMTPDKRRSLDGGYFHGVVHETEYMVGPDFVNLDERLEAIEIDTSAEDEEQVRMMVKREQAAGATGSWFGGMIGWPLFSVQENDEDWSDGDDYTDEYAQERRRRSSARQLEGTLDSPEDHPPPSAQGGWSDAAWLLSVATKVIL